MTIYNWTNDTIDGKPVFEPGGMPPGGTVTICGVDVSPLPIFELKTGIGGHIVSCILNRDGTFKITDSEDEEKLIVHGNVAYDPKKIAVPNKTVEATLKCQEEILKCSRVCLSDDTRR